MHNATLLEIQAKVETEGLKHPYFQSPILQEPHLHQLELLHMVQTH